MSQPDRITGIGPLPPEPDLMLNKWIHLYEPTIRAKISEISELWGVFLQTNGAGQAIIVVRSNYLKEELLEMLDDGRAMLMGDIPEVLGDIERDVVG